MKSKFLKFDFIHESIGLTFEGGGCPAQLATEYVEYSGAFEWGSV
jgi:hypothetical protein